MADEGVQPESFLSADEGRVRLRICQRTVDKKTMVVDLWYPPERARQLSADLLEYAAMAEEAGGEGDEWQNL